MFHIKILENHYQSDLKNLFLLNKNVRNQSLDDFQKDQFSLLNFSKIDNVVERFLPQITEAIVNDRIVVGAFYQEKLICAIMARESNRYPAWSISMILTNPEMRTRLRISAIEKTVKWLLEYYENKQVYECWCAVPMLKSTSYESFHKYFPGRYTFNLEAICKKGSRPIYSMFWTMLGQSLPEVDISLIKWSLKTEYRKPITFEEIYASI
jgi:hypothetical protein